MHDDGTHDTLLIERMRDGDPDAAGELFVRYHPIGRGYARRMIGPDDADDVVAEAFEKVRRAIQRGRGPQDRFLPYLITAVRSVANDHATRAARHRSALPHLVVRPVVDQHGGALGGGALERAFTALPARWQSVLWCTEVLQMSPVETAAHFDLSPNAVSALAYRARTRLRDELLRAPDRP